MTAEEIKKLRNELDISQEKFAQLLGISFATVGRLEAGKAELSSQQEEQLQQLMELLKKQNIDKKKLINGISSFGLATIIGAAIGTGLLVTPLSAFLPTAFGIVGVTNALKKILKK